MSEVEALLLHVLWYKNDMLLYTSTDLDLDLGCLSKKYFPANVKYLPHVSTVMH